MTAYQIETISTPTTIWHPVAVNGNRVAGNVFGVDVWKAVLWDGAARVLNFSGPHGTTNQNCAIATGISSSGDVVGRWSEGRYPSRWEGFVQKLDGSTTYLSSLLPSLASHFVGINDSRVAVGYVERAGGSTVFTLDTTSGSLVDHGKPPGAANALAAGISDSGDIVGVAEASGHSKRGFLLRNGAYTDLGPVYSVARITDGGLIAGNLDTSRPWPWQGVMYDTNKPSPAWQSMGPILVYDVNGSGIAVGQGLFSELRAVVWAAGIIRDLNTFAPASGWRLSSATGINAAGQIVGYGSIDGKGPATFRATPVAAMAAVFVSAGNDGPPPISTRPTSLDVEGQNFPPGTAVNITVSAGQRRGTAMVGPDGSFSWSISIRPALGCNTTVRVIVHGADGIQAEGEGTVFCP
jgi:probable HAF family extracellular repeat protein